MAVGKENNRLLILLSAFLFLSIPTYGLERLRLPNEPHRFTTHPAQERDPSVSPDGRWVLFGSNRAGNWDIYIKPISGGASVRLTDDFSDEYSPNWSPDGKSFVYVSREEDALGDIRIMRLKFAGVVRPGKSRSITTRLGYDGEPAFTPDGKAVCFVSDRSSQREIWLYYLKERRTVKLTDGGGISPDISPDGTIAFIRISPEFPSGEVFIIPDYRQSTADTQLTYSHKINGSPSFSPSSNALVISRIVRDSDGNGIITPDDKHTLWLIPLKPDSSAYHTEFQLTPENASYLQPCWGSDGRIYSAVIENGSTDIFRFNQDGFFGRADSPETQLSLAYQYTHQPEDFLLGLEAVKGYFPATPQSGEALYLKGEIFAQRGDLTTAKSYFLRVMRDYGYLRELSFIAEIGHLQVISGFQSGVDGNIGMVQNPSGFVTALEDIISQRPPNKPLLKALALKAGALFQMGVFSEALEIYTEIIENFAAHPESCAEAQYRTAQIYSRYGETSEVVQSYLKVLRDYPDQEIWNRRAIERIFELELGEDIFAGLQRIMSKHRNYPRLSAAAKLAMARRLVDQGQFELALAEYEPLLKFSGEDPLSAAIRAAAVFEMAEIHFKRNDFIEAIDLLENLAAASPRFRSEALNKMYQAYIDRGEKLNQGGDHQIALAMFDQSRRIAHQELEGHRGYIFTMNKMKRGVEAYREYADSAQAHSGDAVLLYCQGLALSYIGEADPAKLGKSTELIESALALDYRMISAYLTLSYNYQAMEELERAGGVKIGFIRRVYNFTAGVMGKFWRAVTFQGEPEEFSGYEIAINTLNQAIVLNDEKSDPEMEAALLLNLANNYYSLGEFGFKNAYESYMRMLALDTAFHSLQAEASIRERIGRSAMFIDLFPEGRTQLIAAEDIYRRLGDDNSVFRILLMRAELEWRYGDPESSNDLFIKALEQAEITGIEVPQELYFSGIAFNCYQSGEWEMALNACDRSIEELSGKRIARPHSPYKIGFRVLGLTLPLRIPVGFLIGDFAFGESRASEGFSLGDVKSLALSIQASARAQQGEYSEAEEILREKLKLAEYKRDYEEAAACLNSLAWLAYLRGEYSQAAEYTLKSIDKSESASVKIGVHRNIVNLQILSGLLPPNSPLLEKTNRAVGRMVSEIASEGPESARRLLFIPEKSAILTAAGNDSFNQGLSLLKASSINAIIQGYSNIQEACELWEAALALLSSNKLNRQTFILKANLICASALMGDWEYSVGELDSLSKAASANGFSGLLWRLYMLKGEILSTVNPNDPNRAEAAFRTSAAHLEELPPAKYPTHPSIEARKTSLYQRLVSLNLKAGDPYDAFNFAERLSGLRFAESAAQREFEVKSERQKYFWGSGGGTINYFRLETDRIESQLRRSDLTPGERTTLLDEFHNNRQEYLADLQTVREEDPEFASLFSVSPISIDNIQSMLGEGEILLRFFKLEDAYHLWALDSYDILDYRLPVSADSLRLLIEAANSIGTPSPDTALTIISEAVLTPLTEMLKFNSSLMVAPDGAFNKLPFENLIWNGEPLGRNHRLTYAPSASFFYYVRGKRILSGNNLLCLNCNPDYLKISDEFNLLEAPSPISTETLSDALEKADIAIIEPYLIAHTIPLNAGFTIPENEGQPFTLGLFQPFAFDAPLSLLILNGVNLEGSIGRMLLRSFCFSGISGFISIRPEAEPSGVKRYLAELTRNLLDNSALEAHRLAVNAVTASDSTIKFPIAEYWGDCGMNPEQAEEYANRNFRLTVIKGNNDLDSSNYTWAARYYRQAMEMARRLGNQNAQFKLLQLQMQAADSSEDWESALSFQREILNWELTPASAAMNKVNLARYYILSGQIDSARVLANSTIDELIEMELLDKAAQTSLYLAQILEKNGHFIQAETLAEKAFSIQKKAGLPDTLKTGLFRGKLLLEAESYEKSASILEPLIEFGAFNPQDAALGSLWLGRCLLETIDYHAAIDRFKFALESLPEGSDEIEARALQGMADCYYKLGNYTAALDFIRRAGEIRHQTEFIADYYSFNTESLIFLKMGRLIEAEESLLKALELVEAASDRASEVSIRKNLTLCFLERRKIAPALAQARRTLELDRSANKSSSSAYDRLIIAGLFIKMVDFPSAWEQLKSAAEANFNLDDPRLTAKIALAQAYIDCRQNKWNEAEAKILPVLGMVERIGLPELQWRLNFLLGKALTAQGETEEALRRFQASAEIAASLIIPAEDWDTRTIFLDNFTAPFDEIIVIQVESGQHFSAMQTAEKARWLLTKFSLFKRGVSLRSGEPYAEAEAGLRSKLLALNHKLEFLKISRQNPEIIPHISKTIETVRQEYSDLLTAIQRHDSLYHNLIAGSEPDIELAQLLLHIGEAMVYYHIGNGVVCAWALAQDTITSLRIDIDPERLNREIDSFRQLLEGILNPDKNAHWFYDKLLAPFESILTGYESLVIVPDGRLYEIPFDALLDNEGRYCIDRWEISYAFGLREFKAAQELRGVPEAEVTLLAVPDFPGTQKLEFAPLEVESIAFTLPEAHLLFGDEVTSEAVFNAVRTGDIIHLVCHVRTAPDTPLDYALLIEPQEPDGALSARRVYGMKSGAGLVFLSACGSNNGDYAPEAFISLQHAFRIAGSGAVISSLWKADDLSSGIIAKRFYRQVSQGVPLRRALRSAGIFIKQEINAHPAYWAGLQLYGNRNRLQRFNTYNP